MSLKPYKHTDTLSFLNDLETILANQDLILSCSVRPIGRSVDGEEDVPIHLIYSVRVEDKEHSLDYYLGRHDPRDKSALIDMGVGRVNEEFSGSNAELTKLEDGRICLKLKSRDKVDPLQELTYSPVEQRYEPPKRISYTRQDVEGFLRETGTTLDSWGGRKGIEGYLNPQ